jgi:two-component system, OmpR family, sensor kinase
VTLRTRLLLVLVGVVAAGLVVSDVVVYAQLRSFLYSRVDSDLQAASYTVSGILFREHSLPFQAGPPPTGGRPGSTVPSTEPSSTTPTTHSLTLPTGSFPFAGPHRPGRSRDGQFPEGTIGELVGRDGKVVGTPVTFVYGGSAPPGPALPHPLPTGGGNGATFSTGSVGGNTVAYRVLARPLHVDGLTLVVAVPLTETDQTLGRLALVMVLVSLSVLIGLGALAWWIVRRGLRPLEEMAVTAGAIAGGDLGRRVTPAEDRTEVGRLGLALNAMLGEIETAFAARTASEGRLRRFLADASHELRTPLTSIRGYAEIFDLGARERPEDLATAMHHIRDEADRMNVLVDDLLLLARLDRERPLDLGSIDLVPVVTRAVAAVRAVAPDHPVSLVTPAEVMVTGDSERLRQVVDNLLVNAVRHSPEGGPVEMRVIAGGADVVVEVADHGPGVPPEDADRIFEPFFRSDSSRARTTGGAGLGLAIVAAIARAHGGAVGVRANRDGGALFWVRLPIQGAAPDDEPDPPV